MIWILAVGSDARPGEDMTRSRGDAIQMVGINTRTGAASAIGVPRDSWVPIPGHGSNRVNAGLYFGGPQLMGQTVGNLVGVQPDYVMVTRFPFFENMIDDIGGIYVDNPRPFSDPYLKPKGFKAGPHQAQRYDAMAFSRIRKGLAGGDFDRSANQQRTLRGIHARIRARADEPGFIERGVMTVLRNTATNASPAGLFELAQAVAQVRAVEDPYLRRRRPDRHRRGSQHRLPQRVAGPPLRQRRPQRRHPRPLLTPPVASGARDEPRRGWGRW